MISGREETPGHNFKYNINQKQSEMKRIVMLIMVAILPYLGTSQSIFDKFEDSDRIGSVTINKGMLNIVAKMMEYDDDVDSKECVDIARSINNIKVFSSSFFVQNGNLTRMHMR